MTRFTLITISGLGLIFSSAAMAGQAETSATATNGWGHTGSAGATANWTGGDGQGFARTDTSTGKVNLARGVAVGADQNGIDLSFSHAVAPKFGPAYAGTLNMSIGTNGQVSGSYGGVVANGGTGRTVAAGGSTSSRPGGAATAVATGNTRHGGTVQANTHSYQSRPNTVTHRTTVSAAPRTSSVRPNAVVRAGGAQRYQAVRR